MEVVCIWVKRGGWCGADDLPSLPFLTPVSKAPSPNEGSPRGTQENSGKELECVTMFLFKTDTNPVEKTQSPLYKSGIGEAERLHASGNSCLLILTLGCEPKLLSCHLCSPCPRTHPCPTSEAGTPQHGARRTWAG